MDYKKEIGRRIKAEREREELSLEELSKRTGEVLSKSRIGNYEQGTRTPGPQEANILASALHCDAAYLMCLQQSFTKQEIDLLRNFRVLPERDRNEYQRRIDVLAMAYREPVADERLKGWETTQGAKPTKKKKNAAK